MREGNRPLWPAAARTSASRCLAVSLCLAGLNGCALFSGNGPKVSPPPAPPPPPRSELVLLNVSEASGWVAYACDPDAVGEPEMYRIVVLRQTTGEIIYDSQVPLTANLCTHGFEMAPTDPRLEQLARNVDRNIIAPLEAYGTPKNAPTPRPTPRAAEPEVSEAPESLEPEPGTPAIKEDAAVQSPAEREFEVPGELKGVRILSVEDDTVFLIQDRPDLLTVGRRVFLRRAPKVIALPGMEREAIVSKGEVAGLVEITRADGTEVTARLLSGEVPENGTLEAAAVDE